MAERSHETSDLPVRAVLFWTGLAALAIALAVTALYFIFERGDPGPDPATLWAARPGDGPRLQRDPAIVLETLRERDRPLLEDGPLTIEQAMAETARAGWREGDPDPSRVSQAEEQNPEARARRDRAREPDLADEARQGPEGRP